VEGNEMVEEKRSNKNKKNVKRKKKKRETIVSLLPRIMSSISDNEADTLLLS